MKLDNMFKKMKPAAAARGSISAGKPEVPEGLLRRCNKCRGVIIAEEAEKQNYICPKCGGYFHVPSDRRISMIADAGTFQEWDEEMPHSNPLQFRGYPEKLAQLRKKTGLNEAVTVGKCYIDGNRTAIGICDGRFLMASMGETVGEKLTRCIERATKERLPVVFFACSGGARMQEGIVSLMQMAKISAALRRHSDAGLLYISVLTDPTMGGVTASFAMQGDVILAEPGALIGFAGPRVIEQTIRQKLPKGFQSAEFLLEHGFLDAIVERQEMKRELGKLLRMHGENCGADAVRQRMDSVGIETTMIAEAGGVQRDAGLRWNAIKQEVIRQDGVPKKNAAEKKDTKNAVMTAEAITGGMTEKTKGQDAWQRVQRSRSADRPVGMDYIEALFTDFIELHGDRQFGDDAAIRGGVAWFHGQPVTVIAQQKGGTTKENIACNFGMPKPEGYRKALRLMQQAEKFHRPVICFVDTPGAFCGMEAEERGQGEAIARNLFTLAGLRTPVLSIITGEGGSGGALALAVADEVWMLENSVYSILSPEGFASILWKDASRAKEAARVMRMTAQDLKKQGIIEQIFPEGEHYTRQQMGTVRDLLDTAMQQFLQEQSRQTDEERLERRYARFRKF